MQNHRLMMSLCAAAVALSGCGPGDDTGSLDDQRQELYALSTQIWSTTSIPVCWENPSAANATARGWVQTAVANTWAAVTDVTFTGWGTCVANSTGVRIQISDVAAAPHVNGLGRALNGMVGGMVLNFTYNSWSADFCRDRLQYCDQAIAVHEFGHALGFAHEQNRLDRPPTCTDAPQGENGDTLVGPFDNNSVMNYCNPNWINGGALSIGDVRGVRMFYGSRRFVRQLYRDILEREADAGGLAAAASALDACNGNLACLTSTRVQFARSIFESPENRAQNPELKPGSPNYNASYVTNCYANFLRRQPDSAGFTWWLNALNASGDYSGVISGFITSEEYLHRFDP